MHRRSQSNLMLSPLLSFNVLYHCFGLGVHLMTRGLEFQKTAFFLAVLIGHCCLIVLTANILGRTRTIVKNSDLGSLALRVLLSLFRAHLLGLQDLRMRPRGHLRKLVGCAKPTAAAAAVLATEAKAFLTAGCW